MNHIQVAIYARVSCQQQVSTHTIESQLTALKAQVQADGYACGKHLLFEDEGYSGSTLIRPALEQLRDAIARGDIDKLYVHSPDRLARKYAYQVVLVDEFTKAGVEVIFLNHPLGKSAEDDLLLQVQGMVSEYERAKILERSRRGKRHAAQSGSLNAFSRAPYGYTFISKHLNGGQVRMDINWTTARHVQQMFHWYVHEHLSLSNICRRLEGLSIPSPSGQRQWTVTTVARMLRNPHYKGCACFGKWRRAPKQNRLRPVRNASTHPRDYSIARTASEVWICVPVAAIIDEALFEATQDKLEQNRARFRQRKKGASHLLQGLVVCGLCGYGYNHSVKSSNARTYRYYQCNAYRNGMDAMPKCPNTSVRAEALEAAVWKEVCQLLKDPQQLQQEYQRRLGTADSDPYTRHQKTLDSQIHKLQKGIERMIDAYAEGVIDKPEFEPRLRAMRERLKGLETQLKMVKDEAVLVNELKLVISQLEEFADKVADGLDALDWVGRRELIKTLVKRVKVFQDHVKVVFRIGSGPLNPKAVRTMENSPHCCDCVSFVHPPRVIRGLEIRTATLIQLGAVGLHPAVNCRVVNLDTALQHHFCQIPIAQAIA